jgi:hypothetical protein
LTGSRCSETTARASLSVYFTERMLSVILEKLRVVVVLVEFLG